MGARYVDSSTWKRAGWLINPFLNEVKIQIKAIRYQDLSNVLMYWFYSYEPLAVAERGDIMRSVDSWQDLYSLDGLLVLYMRKMCQFEFFHTFEQQTSPGFVKRIDMENLIKTTKGGHLLVDVPEMPGMCLFIDWDSMVRKGYLHNKGKQDNCLFVRFRENGKYLLMEKKTGKTAFMDHDQIRTLWRMGFLNKKARELDNRYETLSHNKTRSKKSCPYDI